MSKITDFYNGRGVDQHGRTLEFILAQDDAWWEECHDHIQWVLPTNKPSQFNPNAPLLTLEDIVLFKSSNIMVANARMSFHRFISFLGLQYDFSHNRIHAGPNFASLLEPVWLIPNHNHLRVTRCLEFLKLIGSYNELDAFYQFLVGMRNVYYKEISISGPSIYWAKAYRS